MFDPERIKQELDTLAVITADIDQVQAEIEALRRLAVADPKIIEEALTRVEWNRLQVDAMTKFLKELT